MDAVRAVVRYWRETRQGYFRLSVAAPHVVTTIAETPETATVTLPAGVPISPLGARAAALMGMYL